MEKNVSALSSEEIVAEIIANEEKDPQKIETARKIIRELQKDLKKFIAEGSGPFIAAIYDEQGKLLVKTANSVVREGCSHNHSEMNAIREAEKLLGTYDLTPYNLKMYVSAEPCMMCLGGIMWSGIREVYYGISTESVESITGFDEGFKPNWLEEFKKRGITVYGNIERELGEQVLKEYMAEERIVYRPER